MPSLKAIKRRITSVKNTQKITRAMKLVAAAKLRRAQDSILAARPYATALERVVVDLSGHAGSHAHPLLEERDGTRAELVLLTSDRGLAGSFNAQLIRRVEGFVEEELADFTDVSLRVVGRKGHEYFKRRNANIRSYDSSPTSPTALDLAREMSNRVVHDFLENQVDRVYLVYNEFTSAISQTVIAKQILPIVPESAGSTDEGGGALSGDYHYEPGKDELLGHLLPLHVEIGIYRAALESIASELGARMSAMDSATRNAGEMIDRLTLVYNRARQASITKELLEIISGAEALKG